MRSCTFCRIVAGEAPAEVVYDDDHVLGFMDALPMTAGHALIVPKRHVQDLFELGADDAAHLMRAAAELSRRMVRNLGAQGLNLLNNNGAAADQSQFHIHLHLIPRYGDDRLLHPWERRFGHWPEIREHAARIRGAHEPAGPGDAGDAARHA